MSDEPCSANVARLRSIAESLPRDPARLRVIVQQAEETEKAFHQYVQHLAAHDVAMQQVNSDSFLLPHVQEDVRAEFNRLRPIISRVPYIPLELRRYLPSLGIAAVENERGIDVCRRVRKETM